MKRFLVDFNKNRCNYFRLYFRSLLHVVHIVLYETIKKLYFFFTPRCQCASGEFPPPLQKKCVTEIFGKDGSHFSSYQQYSASDQQFPRGLGPSLSNNLFMPCRYTCQGYYIIIFMTCRYTRVKIDQLMNECPDRPSLLLQIKVGLIYIWNGSVKFIHVGYLFV